MITHNLTEASQAYKKLKEIWEILKPSLLAGDKYTISIQGFDEAKTHQQRKYYHGYILKTISQTAVVNGRKFSLDTWKEHYRKEFLPDEVVEVVDIKTGAVRNELQRVSTESLGVKKTNELIEMVSADAATEYGVVFDGSFAEWYEQQEEGL